MSRAAAAVWGKGESRSAHQVITKFATTQPQQAPTRRSHAPPTEIPDPLRQRIHAELIKGFKHFPRKSGSGPGGSRYEHWAPLAQDPQMATDVASCLMHMIDGRMPFEALDAFLAANLVGIGKRDGGTQVLGQGGTARRRVGRAVAHALNQEIAQAAGPRQYGLRKDGASALHRRLTAHVAANPDTGIVSLDIADAFTAVDRDVALDAVARHCPDLYPIVLSWLNRSTDHVVPDTEGGPSLRMSQHRGLDQGCPLSPGIYSITSADPLASTVVQMRCQTYISLHQDLQTAVAGQSGAGDPAAFAMDSRAPPWPLGRGGPLPRSRWGPHRPQGQILCLRRS